MVDPLDRWRAGVRLAPALPGVEAHTIHAYFNANPESPDGSHLLAYVASGADDGGGELRVVRRADGRQRTLARVSEVEDAHRAACQQWSDGGRTVVWHDRRDGRWLVLATDLDGGGERILAVDRQLGFGTPTGHTVPLYGCHWRPAGHRDLELADVRRGHQGVPTVAVPITAVLAAHGEWIRGEFGPRADEQVSVFFPVVSPDGRAVFFKLARGNGGDDFRSPQASHRAGKVVWDLTGSRPSRLAGDWGHPSWSPDSTGIVEKGQVLTSVIDGGERHLAPGAPSDHPSLSPDGRLFVTDCRLSWLPDGSAGDWGIVVGSTEHGGHLVLHRFRNDRGADSWRRSHPHPVFSADGRRIHFNLSDGRWTTLMVAEARS